jgi:5-bromo-4-chloroindolyl phosphate hydrolysis protein
MIKKYFEYLLRPFTLAILAVIAVTQGIYNLIFQPQLFLNFGFLILDFLGILIWPVICLSGDVKKIRGEIEMKSLGISPEMVQDSLSEWEKKCGELVALAAQIRNDKMKQTVMELSGLLGKIIKDIEDDPKDFNPARTFLNRYLETTLKIIQQYLDLSGKETPSGELKTSLERVEKLLFTLKQAYEKHLNVLLENNVMDLNVEMEVLEKTLKMEGY